MSVWHETLSPEARETLFTWMRAAGRKARGLQLRSRELEAPQGQLAVGAGAFDPFLQAAMAQEYLSALRRGADSAGALASASAYGALCVRKHNAKRPKDAQWQRSACSGTSALEILHRSLLERMGEAE